MMGSLKNIKITPSYSLICHEHTFLSTKKSNPTHFLSFDHKLFVHSLPTFMLFYRHGLYNLHIAINILYKNNLSRCVVPDPLITFLLRVHSSNAVLQIRSKSGFMWTCMW